MIDPELPTEMIPVDLGDGVIAQIEVLETGRKKVNAEILKFESVGRAIAKISQVVAAPIKAAKPTKATIKYGLAIKVEQGSLVAAIVRGTGTANLEITLEWTNTPPAEESQSSPSEPES
jgi:Trypsin-co-occurring domain 1